MKTYLNKRFSKCSAEQEMVINGMNVWKCLEVYGICICIHIIYTYIHNTIILVIISIKSGDYVGF